MAIVVMMRSRWLLLALPMLVFAPATHADQWRATAPGDGAKVAASQQTLLDMYQQIQSLQEENARLRDKVEIQENELHRLQNRLRSVTEDLDRRVQQLERGGGGARPATGPATGSGSTPAAPASASDGGDQKAYDAAFRLMKQGDYTRASRSFRQFLQKYPSSPLAGNAQYWIAESNYLVRNYKLALEEFQKVMHDHPNSRKVPDAMLKVGYCHYELKDYKSAKEVLTEITLRYPNTLVARSASSRLALIKKEGR